jgi:formylglycine-generating enzyme required for sulfatase activity
MGAGIQTQGFMKGVKLPPRSKAFDDPHRVVLTHGFCIDATEVTARQYEACVESGACAETLVARWSTLHRFPDLPVNDVDWKQARAYCRSVGKDLPTEAEWEWTAKGDDDRKWPWGDERPTCEHADFTPSLLPTPSANTGCGGGNASVPGAHPKGDRHLPGGDVHDLAGNVWEWVLDNAEPYVVTDVTVDPLVVTDVERAHVVRGGGWNRSEVALRTTYRGSAVVGYQRPALGFRCARHTLPSASAR